MYGCPLECPEKVSETDFQRSLSPFLFPQIYDRNSEFFTLEGCDFNSHLCKASTMRMVMVKELGITCAYTLEASLSGHCGYHFNSLDLQIMGHHYLRSLLEFSRHIFFDGVTSKILQCTTSHYKVPSVKIVKSQSQYCVLDLSEQQKRSDKDYGSDSNPSEDNLEEDDVRKLLASHQLSDENRMKKQKRRIKRSSLRASRTQQNLHASKNESTKEVVKSQIMKENHEIKCKAKGRFIRRKGKVKKQKKKTSDVNKKTSKSNICKNKANKCKQHHIETSGTLSKKAVKIMNFPVLDNVI